MEDKARILIVDDSPINIKTLATLLKDNYKIVIATGGAEAIRIAKENPPDLILLDVIMPDMDGFQVCEALKKDAVLKTVPVMFITALSEESDRQKGLDVGGIDFITKPFDAAEVFEKVAKVCCCKRC